MNRILSSIMAVAVAFVLTGCMGRADAPPSSLKPVCAALGKPIKYNSTNPLSDRYAARLLAPDIAEKNRIGRNLRCPNYR